MNNKPVYSFYFSLKGSKTVPGQIVYVFMGIMGIIFLWCYIFKTLTGLVLFLSYPVLFIIVKQHLQIDFTSKMCRLGLDYVGFTVGKWIPLPQVEYVSVFRKQYAHKKFEDGGGLNWSDTFEKIEVNLILNRRETLTVWVGTDKTEAIEAAKYIARHLELRVLDATQREFVWMD